MVLAVHSVAPRVPIAVINNSLECCRARTRKARGHARFFLICCQQGHEGAQASACRQAGGSGRSTGSEGDWRSATQIRAPHSTHINTFWLLSNSHHNYGKTGEFEFFFFFFECLTSNRGNNSVNLFTTFYMVMIFMGPLLKTTQTVVS